MTTIRPFLIAAALAFFVTATLTPSAAADNCDIFINPEDCQNTGWTVGTIATLTGGVAVAVAATMAGSHAPNQNPTVPPPPGVPPLRPPRPPRPSRDKDESPAIDDIEVRSHLGVPTITVQPEHGSARAHSVRLEVNWDPGIQTVREVYRDSH